MSYQIIDRIIYFRSNPVNVNVKINYNQSLEFPAVTICNQNAFNCHWSGLPCGPVNFTEHLTDYGYCYRFVAPENARSTGSDNGLNLLLNVEQYEYMPGPNDAAGVKVLTHVKDDHPRVRELGIAVPTGTQAFIGLQVIMIHNLKKPHGQCQYKSLKYFPRYSYDSCLAECYTNMAARRCGCRDFYMPSFNDDLSSLTETCDCPTACEYTVYDPVLSYATTSDYAGQRLMDNTNITALNAKLKRARETTHRMEERKLRSFEKNVQKMEQALKNVKQLMEETIKERIANQIENVTFHYKNIMRVTQKRILLLKYQIYNVQKNFMRGRDAMEERTLSHLCNSFHEFVFAFETNLRNIVGENETDIKRVFYINTLNMIDVRTENAKRSLANFTVLYNAYVTGTPIFKYKFLNFARKHNTFIVPRLLMNDSTYHNS
uniref:Amiloride-sensitive cation channel 2-B, neuronal n=1 Tax=Magallana gigas TaxID=29159 RepID=K1QLG3_MAGGI